nr:defensin Ec-AMP-D2-like [Ipomoea batatas]
MADFLKSIVIILFLMLLSSKEMGPTMSAEAKKTCIGKKGTCWSHNHCEVMCKNQGLCGGKCSFLKQCCCSGGRVGREVGEEGCI